MKNILNKRNYFLPLIALYVIGIIVGSFLDFDINNAVYSPTNGFGRFLTIFGEYPYYSLVAFLGTYLFTCAFKYYIKEEKRFLFHNIACGLLGIFLALYYFGGAITNVNGLNITGGPLKLMWYLIAAVLISPAIFFGAFCAIRYSSKYSWRTAFHLLFAIALAILLVQIVKSSMHRPRFRSIIADGTIPFKNWWEMTPNYKDYLTSTITKEEFKSFPSGHSCSAASLYALPFALQLTPAKSNTKFFNIAAICTLIYAPLLAFARILVGAHYLSDVSFGGLIPAILILITVNLMYKKKLLN